MPRPIVFIDVNGTALDDWPAVVHGVNGVLAHYSVPRVSAEAYISEVARCGDYERFYRVRGIRASRDRLYELFLPAYRRHLHEVSLMPGVHEALARIARGGYEVHILTAARKDFVEPLLTAAGIHELCDSCHYHVHDKAAQVEAVLYGTEVSRQRCALLGDIPSDMRSARQAGVRAVAFKNPHVPAHLFKGVPTDAHVSSFAEFGAYLLP